MEEAARSIATSPIDPWVLLGIVASTASGVIVFLFRALLAARDSADSLRDKWISDLGDRDAKWRESLERLASRLRGGGDP